VTVRQVRYLVAGGLIPRPRGLRCAPEWGDDHIRAVRRCSYLREAGFTPANIKVLLSANRGTPFPVAPGVTLVIDPKLLGHGADTGALVRRLDELLKTFFDRCRLPATADSRFQLPPSALGVREADFIGPKNTASW
jgi:MerR family copper efflux transcriptional regulator